MFQFRRFPTYTYFIQYMLTVLLQPGCPIRKSSDITPAYDSPKLIAVNHVLHRLPVPRHSPCALCSLTFSYAILLNDTSYFSLSKIVINYPFLKILCLFKTVGIVSYLSFVLHFFFVQFSRNDHRRISDVRHQMSDP